MDIKEIYKEIPKYSVCIGDSTKVFTKSETLEIFWSQYLLGSEYRKWINNQISSKLYEYFEERYKEECPRKINYYKYINSYRWRKLRQIILEKRGYKCERCGEIKNLQVHHLNYNNLGNEKDEDLLILCQKCHSKEHNI